MTKSKILLELKLIPAWRNAREIQASSSWGLPSMEVRTGRGTWCTVGADLAVLDTRMLLPPGTQSLAARSCRGRSRARRRWCSPWFSWSSQSCWAQAEAGHGVQGHWANSWELFGWARGYLGGDAPALGLGKFGWGSPRTHRSFTPCPCLSPSTSSRGAAGRSHPAPQGKVLKGDINHDTKAKTLNKRLHRL